MRKLVIEHTANVDIQFAEVSMLVRWRKLHDEVSVWRHVARTLQHDYGSVSHSAWVLTTDVVISRCWCRHCRWHVGQTDDEIVRSVSWTTARTLELHCTYYFYWPKLQSSSRLWESLMFCITVEVQQRCLHSLQQNFKNLIADQFWCPMPIQINQAQYTAKANFTTANRIIWYCSTAVVNARKRLPKITAWKFVVWESNIKLNST